MAASHAARLALSQRTQQVAAVEEQRLGTSAEIFHEPICGLVTAKLCSPVPEKLGLLRLLRDDRLRLDGLGHRHRHWTHQDLGDGCGRWRDEHRSMPPQAPFLMRLHRRRRQGGLAWGGRSHRREEGWRAKVLVGERQSHHGRNRDLTATTFGLVPLSERSSGNSSDVPAMDPAHSAGAGISLRRRPGRHHVAVNL